MSAYNVWNKWDKLKTVALGTVHPIEYFDHIKNPKIKDPLTRILEETQEDLDNFESVLKQFGCTVLRCPTLYGNSKQTYKNSLNPRDSQLVIGNTLAVTQKDNKGIIDTLRTYNSNDIILDPSMYDKLQPIGSNTRWGWPAPIVTVVGDRIYWDSLEMTPVNVDWLKRKFPDFTYIEVKIGGHNDGVFHTIKPGAILSLHDAQTYEETFPGWEVCYLPDQSWSKVDGFLQIKEANKGKWWIPGEENNEALIEFVNKWLSDWVGYVEETVFDVNVLVLDEHHVCVSNPHNEQVNAFLKKHNMEPVYIPWRHRYFWDGGLHCITLDLEREGTKENYF